MKFEFLICGFLLVTRSLVAAGATCPAYVPFSPAPSCFRQSALYDNTVLDLTDPRKVLPRPGGGYWVGLQGALTFGWGFGLQAIDATGNRDSSVNGGAPIAITYTVSGPVSLWYLDMANHPGGGIVALFKADVSGPLDELWVAVTDSAGNLVSTFGVGGFVQVTAGLINDEARIAAQSSGSVVVAYPESLGTQVLRLTPAGLVDAAFGSSGKTTLLPVNEMAGAYALAVDCSDQIYIASSSPNTWGTAVAKLTASGFLDSSFGSGGAVAMSEDGGDGWDSPEKLVVLRDGSVLVVAKSSWMNTPGGYLLKFTPTGALDNSFGALGKLSMATEVPEDLGVAGDGSLRVLVLNILAVSRDIHAFDSSGAYLNGFGMGGVWNEIGGIYNPLSLWVGDDGRTVFVGASFTSPFGSMGRVESDGTLSELCPEAGLGGMVVSAVPVPNPNPSSISVKVDKAVDALRLRLYSSGYTLISETSYGMAYAGWTSVPLPAAFLNTATNGLHYFSVEAANGGTYTAAWYGVLYIAH